MFALGDLAVSFAQVTVGGVLCESAGRVVEGTAANRCRGSLPYVFFPPTTLDTDPAKGGQALAAASLTLRRVPLTARLSLLQTSFMSGLKRNNSQLKATLYVCLLVNRGL